MNCHERARIETERVAVSRCRFCRVALCKDHLVASFHSDTLLQVACDHHPEPAFVPRAGGARTDLGSVAGRPVSP